LPRLQHVAYVVAEADVDAIRAELEPRITGAFRDNGPCRDRTYDLGIKSPLLYQLS
jgi:hypothetical protein